VAKTVVRFDLTGRNWLNKKIFKEGGKQISESIKKFDEEGE